MLQTVVEAIQAIYLSHLSILMEILATAIFLLIHNFLVYTDRHVTSSSFQFKNRALYILWNPDDYFSIQYDVVSWNISLRWSVYIKFHSSAEMLAHHLFAISLSHPERQLKSTLILTVWVSEYSNTSKSFVHASLRHLPSWRSTDIY